MKTRVLLWALSGLAAVSMMCTLFPTSAVYSQKDDDEGQQSQIRRGFAIAPVPLNLQGKNRSLLGLGSYIVNAQSGCNDCHTHPAYAAGGDPFLGQPKQVNAAEYLAGGRQFGPFTSRNLTPDPVTGLPADLTFQQFLEVMHKG